MRAIFADGAVGAVVDGTARPAQVDDLERRFATFLTAVAEATGVTGEPEPIAAAARERVTFAFGEPAVLDGLDRRDRAALLVWLALDRMGALAPGPDVAATSRAWYDELRLPGALAAGLRDIGLDEADAWAVTDLVRVLLALPRPSGLRGPARTADARLIEAWLARDPVRTAIGLNTWQGVEYLDRDRFEAMLRWAVRLDAIDAAARAARLPPPQADGRSLTWSPGSASRRPTPTTAWTDCWPLLTPSPAARRPAKATPKTID